MEVISSVTSCPIQRIAMVSPGRAAPSKTTVSDMTGPIPVAQRVGTSAENHRRLRTLVSVETI